MRVMSINSCNSQQGSKWVLFPTMTDFCLTHYQSYLRYLTDNLESTLDWFNAFRLLNSLMPTVIGESWPLNRSSDVTVNPLALQSLFDGELLATVPALELLLLCAGSLVQTLEVSSQDLLAGKTALTQQAGVVLLLYYKLCRYLAHTKNMPR